MVGAAATLGGVTRMTGTYTDVINVLSVSMNAVDLLHACRPTEGE